MFSNNPFCFFRQFVSYPLMKIRLCLLLCKWWFRLCICNCFILFILHVCVCRVLEKKVCTYCGDSTRWVYTAAHTNTHSLSWVDKIDTYLPSAHTHAPLTYKNKCFSSIYPHMYKIKTQKGIVKGQQTATNTLRQADLRCLTNDNILHSAIAIAVTPWKTFSVLAAQTGTVTGTGKQ